MRIGVEWPWHVTEYGNEIDCAIGWTWSRRSNLDRWWEYRHSLLILLPIFHISIAWGKRTGHDRW